MKALFPHKLFSQELFCRRCQKVRAHDVYARENFSTYGGIDAHIPLLCICDKCQTLIVAFSQEFSLCRSEKVNREYAKIQGRNRISPGNWVYFKGAPKPGVVKSVFQGPDKEIINVSFDGVTTKAVECEKVAVESEEAPEGYRLLPSQSSVTLMGDHVYHAIRERYGLCVGFVKDGDKDKLVVLLDDKTLLFTTLPDQKQNLPNDKLQAVARNKLSQIFPKDFQKISLQAGQGIVFLNGLVKNLSTKRAMKACVDGLPKVRGCVDFTRIQSDSYMTDSQIERLVLALLDAPGCKMFDYSVKVSFGKVEISASCYESDFSKELETRVGEIPGVMDLACSVTMLPDEPEENRRQCKEMETDLALHSMLQGARIRVSCVGKKFILEGEVLSVIQKQVAFLSVMKNAKTTSVENRLRIATS
ncbi:MAG: BON domain-containing protein [Fibrobacter sp.]|nr:BON domain-containing protein [Fibrobacter sp.]